MTGTGGLLVDARWVGHYGIGRFSREVLPRLTVPATPIHSDRIAPLSPADPLWMAGQALRRRARLLYSPGPNAGLSSPARQLLTVHDLIHLDVASQAGSLRRLYYERVVFPAVRRCGRVLTVSEFSRQRLLATLDLDERQVTVVGNGCSLTPDTAMAQQPDAETVGLPRRPYVVFVGNVKPYKRLTFALEVAQLVADDLDLVVVGAAAADVPPVAGHPADAAPSVQWVSGVDDSRLAALYAHAQCVLFPSIYEGFGLPALEAMAMGTPTVYTAQAVGEVVGTLGFPLPPEAGAADWVDAVHAAAAAKAHLAPALRERSLRFRWDDVASAVQRAISETAGA